MKFLFTLQEPLLHFLPIPLLLKPRLFSLWIEHYSSYINYSFITLGVILIKLFLRSLNPLPKPILRVVALSPTFQIPQQKLQRRKHLVNAIIKAFVGLYNSAKRLKELAQVNNILSINNIERLSF